VRACVRNAGVRAVRVQARPAQRPEEGLRPAPRNLARGVRVRSARVRARACAQVLQVQAGGGSRSPATEDIGVAARATWLLKRLTKTHQRPDKPCQWYFVH
jgi:hypothetical protein